VAEYQNPATVLAGYVHGPTGLVKEMVNNRYYYQDGSGSTSHLASSTGQLLWWFRYDLQGTPIVYNSGDYQISGSGFDLHLFTGQRWYSELGLYDLRNRFYSPDIGRFLQADPIGFGGDATNLYRYCGNNPVIRSDPNGTMQNTKADQRGARGDGLDFGYFGGDGTAMVSWETRGIDVSGVSPIDVQRAEFDYATYNIPLWMAFGINRVNIFGGIAVPQPILKAHAVQGAPQGTAVPQATLPRTFGTPDETAMVAINGINPKSIALNREFAGLVVQNPDGSYSYTGPYMGTVDQSWPGSPPPRTVVVADWHTHGAYDPNYESEVFSPDDMQGNTDLGYPGYLGTPSGAILKFIPPPQGSNPINGTIITLQPPRH